MTAPQTQTSVEHVVRAQLSTALGGRRGMVEAAVPTMVFTVTFLTSDRLRLALALSVAAALVLLAVRLVQRSTPQFVLNALVGIGIGALFAWRSLQAGGDANDAALAYFLPGILYNAGYTVVLGLSNLAGWPMMGFLVGSVSGDTTAWHRDPAVVRLCKTLTWVLVLPCLIRVVVQGPLYLAGVNRWWDTDTVVALLGTSKIVMGWPLQIAALLAMVWLLARNHTPYEPEREPSDGG